jgi:hypothetical protein
MQKSAGKGLRELVGVYEDSANLQEKEREYLRALGILAESPASSEEEKSRMIKDYNRYRARCKEEHRKNYTHSDRDISPKEAYFHSLLGEKWKTEK